MHSTLFALRQVIVAAFVAIFIVSAAIAQDPGCEFKGNSACGGDNHGQCTPDQRFYTEACSDGSTRNRCFEDNYCASVNKGRSNLTGPWAGGRYNILQLGDRLNITGGAAGPGSGQYTGAYTIVVTWPQAHATYRGTISPASGPTGRVITWDHPAGNAWSR